MKMAVVGGPDGPCAYGGGDEGKVCSVAWQRQHLHHQQYSTKTSIKQAALGGQTLPVVELRPFTKRVWRREHSLPSFSDVVLKDEGGAEVHEPGICPPPTIMRYVRELNERRKTPSARQSVDATHRYRSHLHPKADFSFDSLSLKEHMQDLIPSFSSRQERTKTAVSDDGSGVLRTAADGNCSVTGGSDKPGGQEMGTKPGRESSSLMAAYTRDKPLHQQHVCLMGDKMHVNKGGYQPVTDLYTLSTHDHRPGWNTMRTGSIPNGLNTRHHVRQSQFMQSKAVMAAAYHDRLVTRDLLRSGGLPYTSDRHALQPLREREMSPHKFNKKLGAAQDAFLVLNKTGAPTVVERSLSYEQEVRLERCRREKSFAAVTETNNLHSSHHVAYDSPPTLGELTLMKGREANKSHDGGKAARRKNLPQKNIGPRPAFTHQHNGLERILDNSPASVKSQVGDSGTRSSPGEPNEDNVPLTESAIIFTQQAHAVIPETIRDSDREEEKGESQRSVTVRMGAPGDGLPVVQDDVESLVESTNEYRHTLSDTATTETMHLRNEMTPLSADNRARLLPKEDSYIQALQKKRNYAFQRQEQKGVKVAMDQFQNGMATNWAQPRIETDTGAKTITNDTPKNQSNNVKESSNVPKLGSPELLQEENDRARETNLSPSSGSVSSVDSSVLRQAIPAITAVTVEPAVHLASKQDSEQREVKEKDRDSALSEGSWGHNQDLSNIQNSMGVTTNSSSASSQKLEESDQRPPSHPLPTQESVARNSHAEEPSDHAVEIGHEDMGDLPRPGLNDSAPSGLTLDSGVDVRSEQPQMSTKQEELKDSTYNGKALVEGQQSVSRPPTGQDFKGNQNEIMVDKQVKIQRQHSPSHSQDYLQKDVTDFNSNTSSSTSQHQGQHALIMELASQHQHTAPGKFPGDSGVTDGLTLSKGSDDNSQDSRGSQHNSRNPVKEAEDKKSQFVKDDNQPVKIADCVETVEVTKETTETEDRYDASKTFLTTANVELEEWSDLVNTA